MTNTVKNVTARNTTPVRYKGLGVGDDKKGVYVYTHRARSNSYPDLKSIPENTIKRIERTG